MSTPAWFAGIKLLNEPDINFGIVAGAVSYIDERIWRTSDIYLAIKSFRFVRKTAKTKALYLLASSAKWMLSNPMLPNPVSIVFIPSRSQNRSNQNLIKLFKNGPFSFLLLQFPYYELIYDFHIMRIKKFNSILIVILIFFFKYLQI